VTARNRTCRHLKTATTLFFLAVTLGLIGIQADPARAQTRRDATYIISMSGQRLDDALLNLALQTRRSLGGDIRACRGSAPSLRGTMTLDAALARLLAGSGCRYSIRNDGAIFIRRAARENAPRPEFVVSAASSSPEALTSQLGDIIVTAERRAETLEEAPVALTGISGLQIDRGGVTDMTGVASLTAGMTVTNLGSGRNKILLRGMSDGAFTGLTQSTVALYLNQIPITYSAPDPDLKLVDVDRIEVLRGPQGTLYGTGPIGGVIRTVTRRPELDDFYGEISLTRSETLSGGPNSDYSAVLNIPLINGRLGLRAVAYEERFDGYINDIALNLPRVNDGFRHGGRLALGVRLADEWTLDVGLVSQTIETEDTHYVIRGLGRFRRANLVREPHQNDFSTVHVTLGGDGEWGRFDASVGVVRHDFQSRYDASTALAQFGSRALIGALQENKSIDLLVGEMSFASRRSERFRWLVGAFGSTSDTTTDTTVSAVQPTASVAYGEHRADQMNEVALFGELTQEVSPGVTVTAGLRYFTAGYSVASQVEQGRFLRSFGDENRTSGFSPKLVVAYQMNDDWNLYALVSQGHRTGGFNTAGPAGQRFMSAVGMPSREYRPDTLWNYEAGAKGFLWNDRLRGRLAVFWARWRDIQSDQYLPSGLAYAVNVGDGSNKGIEIETTWRVLDGLEVRANALFADPKITRPSPAFNSRGDAGLPGVPAISANVLSTYHRPLWRSLDLYATAGLTYVGASRLTFDAARRSRMGDYVTGRISLAVQSASWSLTAFIDNPTNTEANTFAFGDPFRLPEGLASTPLRPRTTGITLSWFP